MGKWIRISPSAPYPILARAGSLISLVQQHDFLTFFSNVSPHQTLNSVWLGDSVRQAKQDDGCVRRTQKLSEAGSCAAGDDSTVGKLGGRGDTSTCPGRKGLPSPLPFDYPDEVSSLIVP